VGVRPKDFMRLSTEVKVTDIISVCIGVVFLIISFVYLFVPLRQALETNKAGEIAGRYMLNKNIDNEVVKLVAGYCSYYPTDYNKIYCVNNFVDHVYKYEETSFAISIDECINETGMDCKGWSTFYRAVFTRLGIKHQQIYMPTHTIVMAYGDGFYCTIDQEIIDCIDVGDGK